MADLKQYIAQEQPEVRNLPVKADDRGAGAGLSILGEGIDRFSRSMSEASTIDADTARMINEKAQHQQNVIQRLSQEKMEQVETLQVAKNMSQMRSDFYDKLQKMQDNPSDGMFDEGSKAFEEYTQNMVKNGITPRVQQELGVRAQDFGITFKNELWKAQSIYNQRQFASTYDTMLSNAQNSIYSAKSLDELNAQKTLLTKAVTDAVSTGRVRDPESIEALQSKIPQLSLAWGEANLFDRPQLVKDVASGKGNYGSIMDGVSAEQRTVMINKADEVLKSQGEQLRSSLHESLESDKVQRIKTGEGNSLDLKAYTSAFGAEAGAKAQRELNQATELHTYVEAAKGASDDTLRSLLEKANPQSDPKDSLYEEKQQQYENVQKVVAQAVSDKKDDPFTYFSLNPAVKEFSDRYLKDPTDGNRQQLQNAVLAQMKQDKGMSPGQYAVMPKLEAEHFISQFNTMTAIGSDKQGTAGVRDLLQKFQQSYGDNITLALNQLNNTKGGDKISGSINPLMWHLDNPSVFNLTVQALRKDPKEAMERFGDVKVAKDFVSSMQLDNNLLNYQSSIYSTSGTPESQSLVKGVRETFQAFARDYVQNGGKLKDASSVFFAPYTWGSYNGVSYARPREYIDKTGNAHTLSDSDVAQSNEYLNYYSSRLNPNEIAPESIVNQTRYFSSQQLTKDTKDALNNNVFWATTEDEKGVYMYAKGEIAGAPRQVFKKDGSPVRVNFEDTLTPIPRSPMDYDEKTGQMKERARGLSTTPMSNDTWLDRMFEGLEGIQD